MNALKRTIQLELDAVVARLPEVLRTEGFGVLTEIDMQKTLREKLGVEMGRYKIFGACNPALAQRALQTEPDVGVMLPCNIVVRDDGHGRTAVVAVDPMATMAAGEDALRPIAEEVRARLLRVLDRLGA